MWAQTPTQSPSNTAAVDKSTQSIPTLGQCQLSTQPLNAIDMNTVSFKSQVNTVHVEKEFFNCMSLTSQQQVIVMVSIYSQLFENLNTHTITKSNTVETCVKQLNGIVLGCQMLTPSTKLPTITTCTTQPLGFPVRMNTVVAAGPTPNSNVAETVEAEKEVFSCNPSLTGGSPTTIEDVVIFTKILQDMNTGHILSTNFVVVTCAKTIATLIVACN
jgi:hypothetical protein